jgi:uncharacterized protein YggU (UPF0235/DUF167 family)
MPSRGVAIVQGEKSRDKLVAVWGLGEAEVRSRLDQR